MRYVVLPPAVNRAATHISPGGENVCVVPVPEEAVIHSLKSVLSAITGYTPLTTSEADRAAARVSADFRYAAQLAEGITLTDPTRLASTLTLAAGEVDRNNFTQLLAHLTNAEGVVSSPTDAITIADSAGILHTMMVKQFRALMADYGPGCYAWWTAYRQQVAAATS